MLRHASPIAPNVLSARLLRRLVVEQGPENESNVTLYTIEYVEQSIDRQSEPRQLLRNLPCERRPSTTGNLRRALSRLGYFVAGVPGALGAARAAPSLMIIPLFHLVGRKMETVARPWLRTPSRQKTRLIRFAERRF
jgi:hypothetical protein